MRQSRLCFCLILFRFKQKRLTQEYCKRLLCKHQKRLPIIFVYRHEHIQIPKWMCVIFSIAVLVLVISIIVIIISVVVKENEKVSKLSPVALETREPSLNVTHTVAEGIDRVIFCLKTFTYFSECLSFMESIWNHCD